MTIGFIITFVLILLMAGNLYVDKSETKEQLIQIEKVENIRLQLNEFYSDLTTLLRIQLVNPSNENYQSYQNVVQSLNQVMKDAKIFASLYAIYSGVAFLSISAVFFAPLAHRILHLFHAEDKE